MNEYDAVYTHHCCRCHLRNEHDCEYKNCSKEQFDKWVAEERTKIRDNLFDGNFG